MFLAEISLFECGGQRHTEDMRKASAGDPRRRERKLEAARQLQQISWPVPGKSRHASCWAVPHDRRRGTLPDCRQPGGI